MARMNWDRVNRENRLYRGDSHEPVGSTSSGPRRKRRDGGRQRPSGLSADQAAYLAMFKKPPQAEQRKQEAAGGKSSRPSPTSKKRKKNKTHTKSKKNKKSVPAGSRRSAAKPKRIFAGEGSVRFDRPALASR